MPDICDLILDDHEAFRRRFAELDRLLHEPEATERSAALWDPLADLLEVHAASEEALFYPRLLHEGTHGAEETKDAINDHNDIRDAVRRASRPDPGSAAWWEAVQSARQTNSDHMAEEERGAIADFRAHAPDDEREELGLRWLRFESDHAGRRDLDTGDKDADRYIGRHS